MTTEKEQTVKPPTTEAAEVPSASSPNQLPLPALPRPSRPLLQSRPQVAWRSHSAKSMTSLFGSRALAAGGRRPLHQPTARAQSPGSSLANRKDQRRMSARTPPLAADLHARPLFGSRRRIPAPFGAVLADPRSGVRPAHHPVTSDMDRGTVTHAVRHAAHGRSTERIRTQR